MGEREQQRVDEWAVDELVGNLRLPSLHLVRLDLRLLGLERALDDLGRLHRFHNRDLRRHHDCDHRRHNLHRHEYRLRHSSRGCDFGRQQRECELHDFRLGRYGDEL